jgi:hypothetical protein
MKMNRQLSILLPLSLLKAAVSGRIAKVVFAVLLALAATAYARAQAAPACPRCGWSPPTTAQTITVRTTAELERAVATAASSTTILLQDGTYRLSRQLDFARPKVVLRGLNGDRTSVLLRGEGMQERTVGVAVSISASEVVIADVTIGNVGFHGVQVRGEHGVSGTVLHNIQVMDTGQQLVKGSISDNGKHSQGALVACSAFGYTDAAPSDYTNGVDVLGGRSWTVRDNRFHNVRGPAAQGYKCGPAILFWRDCRDTVVTRNILVDCHRGIALGLTPDAMRASKSETYYDHQRGLVCNNVVCNLRAWGDEGIEINAAKDARVEHNTVLVEGRSVSWSISVRFSGANALVRNNLTSKPIVRRDGGQLIAEGNVIGANRHWFAGAEVGNLRLASGALKAIDAGVEIPNDQATPALATDLAGMPRVSGGRADAGAYEFTKDREE